MSDSKCRCEKGGPSPCLLTRCRHRSLVVQERAQIKKSALEFARARRDIIYSLPADAIRPLAKFTAYEPNKKVRLPLFGDHAGTR